MSHDPWDSGHPYEPFMGRWSRKIAPLFLSWLEQPANLLWLDVGCGTGALCALITQQSLPQEVLGIDPSEAFVAFASRAAKEQANVTFKVAGAENIPAPDHHFDIAVSALALNFFPNTDASLREMRRAVKPGGEIALYVWDYAEGMQMLRYFWDAVIALDPEATPLDEAVRFPLCQPDALQKAFEKNGLAVQDVQALEAPTVFADFDDYWQPFMGAVGPAPGYVASLSQDRCAKLEAALRDSLPIQTDGTIPLFARAWAVRANA
jgi:SAM-dependent methyltransferase